MNNERSIFIILTPGFAKDEADANCIPMQQSFVRSVNELYPQLEIVILSFQYPYHKSKYKWFDNEIIPFSGMNKGGLTRLLLRNRIYATLRSIRKTKKIIGLLSFWCNECAWIGKHFGDRHGIKHQCWILGQDAKKENKYPKKLKPEPEELVALSDFLQDEFEKNHGIRPLHLIPPGIDVKQFPSISPERDVDILAAGSLISLKQYDIFLDVVAEIKKQVPLVKAMLIGEGPERKKLQTRIATSGLQSNISVAGELPHAEVLQYMQRTKIFLHTSAYEGFGVVCIEALHAGARVISFVKPMYSDIQHWHIVADKEEMIQKAINILKNPDLEYSFVTPFLLEGSVKKMMQLFSF
jgi:glycosyltransferase involved in cell wall biosynthesis